MLALLSKVPWKKTFTGIITSYLLDLKLVPMTLILKLDINMTLVLKLAINIVHLSVYRETDEHD